MTSHDELRLLPWSGPNGKPCFLSTDDNGGLLSQLANATEAAQLDVGQEVLEHTMGVLADKEVDSEELRLLAQDLATALRDTLRVAISRGHRLPTLGTDTREGNEGSRLPAAAFG